MRRIRSILFAIMLAYVLTGCVRLDIDMDIKSNGRCDSKVILAVQEGYSDGNELMSEDDLSSWENGGWEWEHYNEGGYTGYLFTKKNVNIKNGLYDSPEGMGMEISVKDGKYILQTTFFEDDTSDEVISYKNGIEASGGYMRFVVHLPEKALDSNATSVSEDGKTLTWNLLSMNKQEAYAEFKLGSPIPWSIGLFVLLLAAGIVILCFMKKKKRRSIDMVTDTISDISNNNIYCPYCGTMNTSDSVFCGRCGAKMKE